ncbi:hypothetical protein ACRAWD_01390 [Caulobacter segnis]
MVLSSASSKTAIGLAYLLKQRGAAQVVGLDLAAQCRVRRGTGLLRPGRDLCRPADGGDRAAGGVRRLRRRRRRC